MTMAKHSNTTRAPVSVIVPVKNEAENLRRCLPALAWADEVFVVDSQSTDETARVASDHGASVVQFHFNGTYPKKKNWALDNVPFRNDWVLIVDADEVVVPELAEEIARRTASRRGGRLLPQHEILLPRPADSPLRLCRGLEPPPLQASSSAATSGCPSSPAPRRATTRPTSTSSLNGKALRLTHELDHHAYPTIAVWVEKHNRYAVWEAAMFERFLREPIPASIGRGKRFKRLLKKVYLRLPMRPGGSLLLRLRCPLGVPGRPSRPGLLHAPGLLRFPGVGERL